MIVVVVVVVTEPVSQQLTGCSGVPVLIFECLWYQLNAAGRRFRTQEIGSAAKLWPGSRRPQDPTAARLHAAEKQHAHRITTDNIEKTKCNQVISKLLTCISWRFHQSRPNMSPG